MSEPSMEKPFANWIGRRSEAEDILTARLDRSFRAILAGGLAATPNGDAPAGIHWCLAPAIAPMEALGPDGHPAKNLDLPPVPQPRRMWAGGRIETVEPLRVGDRVRRVSTIADVACKIGRSGELWFVRVDHEYMTPRGVAVRERQDIVFREAARPGAPAGPVPMAGEEHEQRHCRIVETSPTLLFRYSALTFNGHRIHYDHPYATGVEGYDGLVVHGPLQATLLFNLAAQVLGHVPSRFDYRGVSPAIAGSPLMVCADVDRRRFWTQARSGQLHMEATATAD